MKTGILLGLAAANVTAAQSPLHYEIHEASETSAVPLYIISDGSRLRATIAPSHGGELGGLAINFHGQWRELLYRGGNYTPTKGWGGHAPTLWPAVGRSFLPDPAHPHELKAGGYTWLGKDYPMTIHGFARDLPWRIMAKGADREGGWMKLSLDDSASTRSHYPFGFHLEVTYRLTPGQMAIEYRVQAASENVRPMPFSIGNHLSFHLPLLPDSDPHRVLLQTPSRFAYGQDSTAAATPGPTEPQSWPQPLPLGNWPVNVPLSLGGYVGDPWLELRDPAGLAVTVRHHAEIWPKGNLVQFNLWGDLGTGYWAPEPWVGTQNSLNSHEGLIELKPGAIWRWTILIQPHAYTAEAN